MMKITVRNYEAYFLDYVEGQLSSEQLSELNLFLSLHPDLKQELETLEIISIKPEDNTFTKKISLKKLDFQSSEVCDHNFNDFCIAYHENILNQVKIKELKSFIKHNSEYKQGFELFGKVYIKPQPALLFPLKRQLYHKTVQFKYKTFYFARIGSIAAGIALLITIYLLILQPKNHKLNVAALNTKNIKTEKEGIIKNPHNEKTTDNKHTRSITSNRPKKEMLDTVSQFIRKGSKNEEISLVHIPSLEIKKITIPESSQLNIPEPEIKITSQTATTHEENGSSKLTATVEYTLEKIKREVDNSFKDDKGNFSFIKLVKAGVTGISKITESNMSINEKTDSTGKVTVYSFDSDILKFQKSVRN